MFSALSWEDAPDSEKGPMVDEIRFIYFLSFLSRDNVGDQDGGSHCSCKVLGHICWFGKKTLIF